MTTIRENTLKAVQVAGFYTLEDFIAHLYAVCLDTEGMTEAQAKLEVQQYLFEIDAEDLQEPYLPNDLWDDDGDYEY